MDLWAFGSECKESQNSSSPLSPLKKKNESKTQPLDTSEGTFPYWGTVSRNILEELFKNFLW